jgi:hypothetical protein
MHDTAPHTRYTHATNTKYIYSTPERALMSTVTILVHPSQAQRHSTCSHPDCDLRIRLTEGRECDKGAKGGNDESNSSAPDAAKPRGSVQN